MGMNNPIRNYDMSYYDGEREKLAHPSKLIKRNKRFASPHQKQATENKICLLYLP